MITLRQRLFMRRRKMRSSQTAASQATKHDSEDHESRDSYKSATKIATGAAPSRSGWRRCYYILLESHLADCGFECSQSAVTCPQPSHSLVLHSFCEHGLATLMDAAPATKCDGHSGLHTSCTRRRSGWARRRLLVLRPLISFDVRSRLLLWHPELDHKFIAWLQGS